ncbi:nuclear transport factor 2 family protein [Mucilaginibacter sp. UR6-1]|uniref:nuclear transport factor 2 family protein n=1 Tax=Mucilaginibacter sp. UR6-1 TaxID=1435643 RepID=UPI001E504E1B|nr:nuclear transport factor 2 family protein [Mucilaginibacter sp. UR6-1]MCC8408845.1 nuclear transport factor 2 family protein [Mucilaginibacter sp. UR6-1]
MKAKYLITIATVATLSACIKTDDRGQANAEAAKSMFTAFNRHDWKAMADHYADTASFLDPAFGPAYVKKNRAETAAKYADMQKMFADIKDDIDAIHATGDVVVVEFTSSGTPAGGQKWHLPICSILTFNKDGKIIKDATYYDNE